MRTLTVYIHPNCPVARMKELIRMETDPSYFDGLSVQKLQEHITVDKDRLSRTALMVLARAFTKKLSEKLKDGNFPGKGHLLSDTQTASDSEEAVAKKISIDENQPQTSLAIKFPDGQSVSQKFNTSHTVGDVKCFVKEIRPMSQPFTLCTTFPPKTLDDNSLSLEEAGLLNSVVIVRVL